MIQPDHRQRIDAMFQQFADQSVFSVQIITMRGQQQGKTLLADRVVKSLDHLGKDGVGDRRHHQADSGAALAMHGLCGAIADIAGFLDRQFDLLAGRRMHQVGVIHHPRHRRR